MHCADTLQQCVQVDEFVPDKHKLHRHERRVCADSETACQDDAAAHAVLSRRGGDTVLHQGYRQSAAAVEGESPFCKSVSTSGLGWVSLILMQIVNFNFFPIEPPRPPADGETYARRKHQFQNDGRRGTFQNLFKKSPTSDSFPGSDPETASPSFSVDARLPNPAIITCNQDIPLRIIIQQQSPRALPVYLQSLQVELIGYTYVRAHEVQRRESNSWVICSKANMGVPIGSPDDPVGTETEIDSQHWTAHPLPKAVAPSFIACNIRREYELDVRVGLGYGNEKSGQFTVLPLRLPLKVFSGIRPPAELLKAMEATPERPPALPSARPNLPEYEPAPAGPGSSQIAPHPPTPGTASGAPPAAHPAPAPGYEDAPPSYEDAIASDMPVIDGPRPDYEPPPAPAGESAVGREDEKRPGRFGF